MRHAYLNDSAAVEAARNGIESGFEWLVRKHQKRALAVALGVLHNHEDARDACQDAFLRAFHNIGRFDGQAQFSTWLHRIVVNVCIDRVRRARPAVALDDVEATLAAPSEPTVDRGQQKQILDALAQLSDKHRTALVLREVEGLSYLEIAQAMRCSVGTVMSRLFHARKRLQTLLTSVDEPVLLAAA